MNLPDEILDIILKEYWYDYFKRTVIEELNEHIVKVQTMKYFMINHYYKCSNTVYDKQMLFYYKEHNKYLNDVCNNKALSLFLFNKHPSIRHVLCSKYIKQCYSDVRDDLKYICVYAVTNGNPYMSYYNKQRFINMIK